MAKQKGISKQQLNKAMKLLPAPLQEHAKRVKLLVTYVLEKIKTEDWFIDMELNPMDIISAAFYHDIGKQSLPKDYYYYVHCNTVAGRDKYFTHVGEGINFIENTCGIKISGYKENSLETIVYQAVTEHHERYDGSGYPEGKAGKNISFVGKLIGVVDTFDNLLFVGSSNKIDFDIAVQELKMKGGKELDPFFIKLLIGDLETLENYVDFINTSEKEKHKRNKYGIVLRYQMIRDIRENKDAYLKFDFALNDQYYGVIEPSAFYAIAERTGQITVLEKIAFERLCQAIKRFDRRGIRIPKILITVSFKTFDKKNYFKDIEKIMARNEIRKNQFGFAIRENATQELMDRLPFIINEYHKLGADFYIDEYGEQTSAISELDENRIDGVIVREDFASKIVDNAKIYNVISGLVKIAISVGVSVIAGGIETRKSEEELLKMGVKYGYGSLYAKKMNNREVAKTFLNKGGEQ